MKPGNKLGTLGDFEFVVDYASTISLDIVFKNLSVQTIQYKFHNPIESED